MRKSENRSCMLLQSLTTSFSRHNTAEFVRTILIGGSCAVKVIFLSRSDLSEMFSWTNIVKGAFVLSFNMLNLVSAWKINTSFHKSKAKTACIITHKHTHTHVHVLEISLVFLEIFSLINVPNTCEGSIHEIKQLLDGDTFTHPHTDRRSASVHFCFRSHPDTHQQV